MAHCAQKKKEKKKKKNIIPESGFTSVEVQSGKSATLTCTVAGKSTTNAATTVWKLASATLADGADYAVSTLLLWNSSILCFKLSLGYYFFY